jgi:exonuclease VII small subunit
MGLGAKQDFAKAAFWYEKAAQQGLARAQVNLGSLYARGQGVEKDLQKALFWYQKAAVQGDGRGANHLGLLYEQGLGGKGDISQARQWYIQGAKANYSKAMMNLGRIYEQGLESGEKNLAEASYWYQRAIQLGYTNAASDLQRVESLLVEKPKTKVPAQNQNAAEISVDRPYAPAVESLPIISLGSKEVEPGPQTIAPETKTPVAADLNSGPTLPVQALIEAAEEEKETLKIRSAEITSRPTDQKGGLAALPEATGKSRIAETGSQIWPLFGFAIAGKSKLFALIVLGNLVLALLFWLFMAKRKTQPKRSSAAVVMEIGREIRLIRKRLEELKEQSV